MRTLVAQAILLFALSLAPACALSSEPYLKPGQVDALVLIAPPPAGEIQARDLADVLRAQAARTPALVQRSLDDKVDIFGFGNVLGPKFKAENIPVATAFIRKVQRETGAEINLVKDCWERPRPFVVSKDVHPPGTFAQDMMIKPGTVEKNTAPHDAGSPCKPVEQPAVSYSYPSGNANFGTTVAILLAAMVPEKRGEIFARGWEYGDNRLVAGVHFPSDIESGRISATAMVAVMMQNPAFKSDFTAAKAELRNALGLTP
ncbi:MAG TPA: phosphatase PAP2 family protein [Micropepsaceae bacterium]|jgi:acid phosphatase (class A)